MIINILKCYYFLLISKKCLFVDNFGYPLATQVKIFYYLCKVKETKGK